MLSTRAMGFTLIEVVAVLAIIGVTSSVLLVRVLNQRVPRDLENSARLVAGVFREAQNFALTGHQVVAGSDPCGYDVSWGGTTYGIVYRYKNAAGACALSTPLVSYTLENGVVFSGSGGYSFSLPHASVNFSGTTTTTLSKSSTNHVVCTYASGLINDRAGSSCP